MTDHLKEAIRLARAGSVEAALGEFGLAMKRASQRADALGHRAWVLRNLGRYEESLRDYDELARLRPEDSEVLVQRADLWRLMGECTKAVAVAMELLGRDPMSVAALELLGRCQEAAGHTRALAGATDHHSQPPPWKPVNPVIEQLERDPGNYPGSAFPEVGRFYYSLVRCVRPGLVIETGTLIGYSTLCIAQALEDNGAGHVHSFDIFPIVPDYVSAVIGPCEDLYCAARAHVEKAGVSHRVTLHKGDSSDNIGRVFHDGRPEVHLALIDGDHALEGCFKDWNAVAPLIAPDGLVVVHDTNLARCTWFGPRCLLETIRREGRELYQVLNLPSPEGFGFGLIQKVSSEAAARWRPALADTIYNWFHERRAYLRQK